VIAAHNHPSGDLSPSSEDRYITDRLKQAGDILGIDLIDHIIVSREGFKSMKEGNIF
jgi:DNA repair protein RadC